MVNPSIVIVDLSDKNDNNQKGIELIVLIYKTNGEIDDNGHKEEIKKIKLHLSGCIMDGPMDGTIDGVIACGNTALTRIKKLAHATPGLKQ